MSIITNDSPERNNTIIIANRYATLTVLANAHGSILTDTLQAPPARREFPLSRCSARSETKYPSHQTAMRRNCVVHAFGVSTVTNESPERNNTIFIANRYATLTVLANAHGSILTDTLQAPPARREFPLSRCSARSETKYPSHQTAMRRNCVVHAVYQKLKLIREDEL